LPPKQQDADGSSSARRTFQPRSSYATRRARCTCSSSACAWLGWLHAKCGPRSLSKHDQHEFVNSSPIMMTICTRKGTTATESHVHWPSRSSRSLMAGGLDGGVRRGQGFHPRKRAVAHMSHSSTSTSYLNRVPASPASFYERHGHIYHSASRIHLFSIPFSSWCILN
jgi:hypothetical protein